MSARTDPRGGRWATGVPTATLRPQRRRPSNNSERHSAARELRERIEGKLTEKIDLTVDVNKDIVQRLMAALVVVFETFWTVGNQILWALLRDALDSNDNLRS
jgi:hypothetical protein